MPLNKINILSSTKVDFKRIPLSELLEILKYKLSFDTSEFLVSTDSEVKIHSLTVGSIINLLKERIVEGNLNGISITSESEILGDILSINKLIESSFTENSIDYVKMVSLSSTEDSSLLFKVISKIGISANVVVETPISFGKDLLLKLKVVNGARVVLKIINAFSDKIRFENGYLILDLKPLLNISENGNYILNEWLSIFEGNLHVENQNIIFRVHADSLKFLEK